MAKLLLDLKIQYQKRLCLSRWQSCHHGVNLRPNSKPQTRGNPIMVEPMPHYTVALLSATALAVFIITLAWPHRTAPGAKPLIAYQ